MLLTTSETIIILRTFRDGDPRMATSTFTQLLSSDEDAFSLQCCVKSTETIRLIQ